MKNFLITGGSGFVGSHLAEQLIKNGHCVTILDDLNTGNIKNLEKIKEKINFVEGDVRDKLLLQEICKKKDGIFHLAARASVQESFIKFEEYQDVNVNGTENIFRQAHEYGIKVVYASSSSVYGNPTELPIKENSSMNPINPYAQTKVDKENLATEYAKKGLQVIGMRYFNIFGERQSKEYAGVIKLFLECIQNKLPPKINGDGTQARDFVFVGDVVNANILAMESDIDHAFFNVGTNTQISILEIAQLMITSANLDLKPIFGPELKGDVNLTIANIDLIKKSLNWNPTITIQEWLKQKISNLNY
jgi:nucleoside-diphosphate-sugar epimerase